MAVTKLTRLKESKKGNKAAHLINNIKYICNPEKTEGGLWIGGNAGQEPSTIITTMLRNKQFWNKEDGSQGFHYVIAFPPECVIDEERASAFGRDFVRKLLGDDFYYVTAVHNDQHHMHVHVTFDSVSRTDGMKFHSPHGDWEKRIQPVTDELCRQYHLPVLEYGEDKVGVHYGEWRHRNREEEPYRYTWYDVIRDDIEEGLAHAASMEELIGYLREEGYEVKNGKYLSLRPPGRERAVRTGRLGEAYGKEELIRRIRERGTAHDKGTSRITYGNRYEVWYLLSNKKAEHKTWKMTPIQRQFYRRWHHTYFLRKPGRRNYRRYREDIVEVNKIADALAYLVEHDIRNAEGLGKRETDLESKSKQVSNSIRRLKAGMKTGSSDPGELKELERLKETRREIRKEQKRLEDIRRLYHQEKERAAAGALQNRHREHTRITIHRKLFGRMDLKEGYAARIPGKGGAYVLFPKNDCYMYESGEILSVFLYDEKTYSTFDRDGNNIGKITGRDLKGHYEDKTTSKEDRAADRRNMGGQKT